MPSIERFIYKFMRCFVNNRVGTYLKELELLNIRAEDNTPFMKGQLVVHETQYMTYKFVIYVGDLVGMPGTAVILTKEDGKEDIIEKNISVGSLKNYNKMEPPVQNFKVNEAKLNEDDLLETYTISG